MDLIGWNIMKKHQIALACMVCALALFASSCIPSESSNRQRTVTYKISGSARSVNIMYANATHGNTSVKKLNYIDWQETVLLPRGARAYLTAQNMTDDGSVIVEIFEFGIPHIGTDSRRAESSGAYCIA